MSSKVIIGILTTLVLAMSSYIAVELTADIKDADRDGDNEPYWANWGRNLVTSYRYKLGSNYLNYESIGVVSTAAQVKQAEQVMELMKALDIHDNMAEVSRAGDSALTPAFLLSTRFCVAKKVDKTQKDSDESISSAIDKDRNNVRVELNYSVQPSDIGQIYTHVHLDKRIQILPGSLVRNVRS
jgi:hypothetical protein